MNAYAELHCLSAFSFGRGASSARELFERAQACGYGALAISDEVLAHGLANLSAAERKQLIALLRKAREGLLAWDPGTAGTAEDA